MTQLLTVDDVMAGLKVKDRDTVYKLLGKRIPAVRVGREWRIHPDVFDAFCRGELQATETPKKKPKLNQKWMDGIKPTIKRRT